MLNSMERASSYSFSSDDCCWFGEMTVLSTRGGGRSLLDGSLM